MKVRLPSFALIAAFAAAVDTPPDLHHRIHNFWQ